MASLRWISRTDVWEIGGGGGVKEEERRRKGFRERGRHRGIVGRTRREGQGKEEVTERGGEGRDMERVRDERGGNSEEEGRRKKERER